jgi:hypothetical protein
LFAQRRAQSCSETKLPSNYRNLAHFIHTSLLALACTGTHRSQRPSATRTATSMTDPIAPRSSSSLRSDLRHTEFVFLRFQSHSHPSAQHQGPHCLPYAQTRISKSSRSYSITRSPAHIRTRFLSTCSLPETETCQLWFSEDEYAGTGVSELRELRQLWEENGRPAGDSGSAYRGSNPWGAANKHEGSSNTTSKVNLLCPCGVRIRNRMPTGNQ